MFKYDIKNEQLVFCYNKFYTIKHYQKFVYLVKSKEANINNTIILDVGVIFTYNGLDYKVVKHGNWIGVISAN